MARSAIAGLTEDSIDRQMDAYIQSACQSLPENLDAYAEGALDEIRKQLAN